MARASAAADWCQHKVWYGAAQCPASGDLSLASVLSWPTASPLWAGAAGVATGAARGPLAVRLALARGGGSGDAAGDGAGEGASDDSVDGGWLLARFGLSSAPPAGQEQL